MSTLRENYKDALFDGSRKYRFIQNEDGTYSITDVTEYTQEGDLFGAGDINATNAAVNAHIADTANPHKTMPLIVGPDVTKYQFGMDEEGVYLMPFATASNELGLLSLSDDVDTGFYVETEDGETKSITNVVESESSLTNNKYNFDIL